MKIKWLGHATFEIQTGNKHVFIDPFITENPKSPIKLDDITDADLICVTHDHFDHLGDTITLSKNTGAPVACIFELGMHLQEKGVKVEAMNKGSFTKINDILVSLTLAQHSSQFGNPVGILLNIENKMVYHAGDTSLFKDMELIRDLYQPDVAMLPIGGYYTMGPKEAALAVSFIKPKIVIPIHYGTFPILEQSPDSFIKEAEKISPDTKIMILEIGETVTI